MKPNIRIRGEALTVVLLVLALVGGGIWLIKPKGLDGDSRRAATSRDTTAKLETATTAQGASAAASVAKIGEANAQAPASPSRDFIAREVPAALAKLPAPDPLALIEAEKRRAAVMEGRAQEAARLYESEAKRSAQLQSERDAALAARQTADNALAEAAAARLAAERQRTAAIAIASLLGALWIYAKLYSITPAALGDAAAGIRAGRNPIDEISRVTAPWLHQRIHRAARLATDIDAPKT
jgi:hypothetical protein